MPRALVVKKKKKKKKKKTIHSIPIPRLEDPF
jgi:hypothetical protein